MTTQDLVGYSIAALLFSVALAILAATICLTWEHIEDMRKWRRDISPTSPTRQP